MTSVPHKKRERLIAFRWTSLGIILASVIFIQRMQHAGGWEGLQDLGSLALLSLLFVGKFVIFSGLHEDTPSIWVLAIMVWLLDLLWAIALLHGLGSLERAPVLGSWLRRMRGRAGALIAKYPGLERMAFFGVFTFVMLPIAATGAITGALAARLLALSRMEGLIAIAAGSACTATIFALLAQFVGERAAQLARSPVLVGVIVLVAVLVGRSAYGRVIGELKRR